MTKERYSNLIKSFTHKKLIFKQNETFETRLIFKTKQNRLHHKMVNNKKSISYAGRSKRCNLCLKEKLAMTKN